MKKVVKIYFGKGQTKDVRSKDYKKQLKRLGIDPNKDFDVSMEQRGLNEVAIITQEQDGKEDASSQSN